MKEDDQILHRMDMDFLKVLGPAIHLARSENSAKVSLRHLLQSAYDYPYSAIGAARAIMHPEQSRRLEASAVMELWHADRPFEFDQRARDVLRQCSVLTSVELWRAALASADDGSLPTARPSVELLDAAQQALAQWASYMASMASEGTAITITGSSPPQPPDACETEQDLARAFCCSCHPELVTKEMDDWGLFSP